VGGDWRAVDVCPSLRVIRPSPFYLFWKGGRFGVSGVRWWITWGVVSLIHCVTLCRTILDAPGYFTARIDRGCPLPFSFIEKMIKK